LKEDHVENGEFAQEALVVVLAEDNDDHALLIQMALERAAPGPVEVHRARNGVEAVELVTEIKPQLLLLDLKMPGKTGHEVLEHIKGDDELRGTPVAVLTSSDRDEDIARSYGLGSNHFLTKPEDPAELETRLRSLLRNLSELGGIRRGTGEVQASGESAIGPDSFLVRQAMSLAAIILLLVALLVFGYCSGALG
jgi:CheY-like chemotaxis protein